MNTPNKCSVEQCTKLATAKGLCSYHYHRQRTYGKPEKPPQENKQASCSVPGCDFPATSKGLCSRHYQKARRDPAGFDPVRQATTERAKELGRACTIEGCGLPVHAKGMCKKHYYRNYFHQPITSPMEQREADRMLDFRTARPDDPGYIERFVDPGYNELEERTSIREVQEDNPDLRIFIEGKDPIPEWAQPPSAEKDIEFNLPTADIPFELADTPDAIGTHSDSVEVSGWALEDPGEEPEPQWVPEVPSPTKEDK